MHSSSVLLLSLHLAFTAAMVGLIWFVQVAHYPIFGLVGDEAFPRYVSTYQRRVSWVVGPLMAAEGICALALLIWPPAHLGRVLPLVGLVLLALIHGSTALLQVPAHRELAAGYDPAVGRRLVAGNWVRTVGWSARACLAVAMVLVALPT